MNSLPVTVPCGIPPSPSAAASGNGILRLARSRRMPPPSGGRERNHHGTSRCRRAGVSTPPGLPQAGRFGAAWPGDGADRLELASMVGPADPLARRSEASPSAILRPSAEGREPGASSTTARLRHGPCRPTTAVVKTPIKVSAIALSQESPTLPTDGALPASASRSVYLIETNWPPSTVRGPSIRSPDEGASEDMSVP
jgi:hypothetical protein